MILKRMQNIVIIVCFTILVGVGFRNEEVHATNNTLDSAYTASLDLLQEQSEEGKINIYYMDDDGYEYQCDTVNLDDARIASYEPSSYVWVWGCPDKENVEWNYAVFSRKFIGWNTEEAGDGKWYFEGDTYSGKVDLYLYPQYENKTLVDLRRLKAPADDSFYGWEDENYPGVVHEKNSSYWTTDTSIDLYGVWKTAVTPAPVPTASPGNETSAIETPSTESPTVETSPSDETPSIETPPSETSPVETPAGETSSEETPSIEEPEVTPEPGETPGPGSEVTPNPGGEVTPNPGGEVTPDPGEEVTPNPGGEVTPDPGGEVTPDPGEEVTPDPGEEVIPNPGEEVTPDPGEEVTPNPGGEVTPDPTPVLPNTPLPIPVTPMQTPANNATYEKPSNVSGQLNDKKKQKTSSVKKKTKSKKQFTVKGVRYEILSNTSKKRTVAVIGVVKKNQKKYDLPDKVKYQKKSFKVVNIRKGAFKGCKKTQYLYIRCKSIQTIEKGALNGMSKKCNYKIIKSRMNKYRKMIIKSLK